MAVAGFAAGFAVGFAAGFAAAVAAAVAAAGFAAAGFFAVVVFRVLSTFDGICMRIDTSLFALATPPHVGSVGVCVL